MRNDIVGESFFFALRVLFRIPKHLLLISGRKTLLLCVQYRIKRFFVQKVEKLFCFSIMVRHLSPPEKAHSPAHAIISPLRKPMGLAWGSKVRELLSLVVVQGCGARDHGPSLPGVLMALCKLIGCIIRVRVVSFSNLITRLAFFRNFYKDHYA